MSHHALVLVDIQRDFCPGGALAIPDGESVILVANHLMQLFSCVVVTLDLHPPNHSSFAKWGPHCVVGTRGAAMMPYLNTRHITHVVTKGTNPRVDSHSAFYDDEGESHGLDRMLEDEQVTDLYVMGLATEYCVKATVLDALMLDYKVRVVEPGCRGLTPEGHHEALRFMKNFGAQVVESVDKIFSEV